MAKSKKHKPKPDTKPEPKPEESVLLQQLAELKQQIADLRAMPPTPVVVSEPVPPGQRWVADLLKLDFGCGKNPREGFAGVDVRDFGQPHKVNLVATRQVEPEYFRDLEPTIERVARFAPWPWADESVDEAHTSHFLEHLTALERVHFVNELYRVLKPGAKMLCITPHWASQRAYGDLTHAMPPVSEFWFYYLKDEWRRVNAPHNDFYTCNFESQWGYSIHQALIARPTEYQTNALSWYKEAAQDTIVTLVKLPPYVPPVMHPNPQAPPQPTPTQPTQP